MAGNFSELKTYKNDIMLKLIGNDNIVKALSLNYPDFIDRSITIEPTDLLYTQIFPYKCSPYTQNEQKTFITMKFGDYRLINRTYKSGKIWFYIFTHYELMRTNEGLRSDYLINQIDSIFNESSDFGIGKMQWDSMDDFQVNEDFMGSMICYKDYSFNKV